ncbi:uncharacterized protein L3040_005572 [Drepanopeziza brunnea f. sp. 'multigermtubi']|uniref:Peroxin n=1 Tax=Marssonina brunnea f. sp. multigermtubi (strain MB_m1) TaxID=1072389 RepID=K1W987_MARBU|nr:peroxin [Drepanopeziza brunnea f. sp. 'multigermtubi' MB_m1]EKD13810.1 peroxin [Drepanopeziza brunnea f. sp. 'multigermtubi' MB_m1]KAJ5041015.1 hypothetical protein L3040_005572 [Drepanopeziza brunnea f. sp. 'multigermtubi']
METKPGDPEGSTATSGKTIQKDAEAISKDKDPAPKEGAPSSQDAFPDPDEDDLDDLDDMLDEFTPTRPEPPSPSSKPTTAPKNPIADGISDEEFAVQLQAGMAELMGELETSPDMQSQLAQMLKELGGGAALDSAAGQSSAAGPSTKKKPAAKKEDAGKAEPSSSAPDESFQETIKKTMERMQNSGDQATAAAASDNTDDILAQMMKAMESGGLDGEGGEEEFSKMLLGMMEQLTNKEILYEPMKELNDKFPGWMEKNAATVDAADLKRYREQQVYVSEIVKRFETKTYKDENVADRDYIVERMQKMQAAGSPPADLVGDMASAQEAFGGLDGAPEEGCPTQ